MASFLLGSLVYTHIGQVLCHYGTVAKHTLTICCAYFDCSPFFLKANIPNEMCFFDKDSTC